MAWPDLGGCWSCPPLTRFSQNLGCRSARATINIYNSRGDGGGPSLRTTADARHRCLACRDPRNQSPGPATRASETPQRRWRPRCAQRRWRPRSHKGHFSESRASGVTYLRITSPRSLSASRLLLFLMSASRGQTEHRDFGHLWPVIFLYLSSSSYVLFIFIFTFVFALPFATLTAATV